MKASGTRQKEVSSLDVALRDWHEEPIGRLEFVGEGKAHSQEWLCYHGEPKKKARMRASETRNVASRGDFLCVLRLPRSLRSG